jgi:hypothetical protein
MNNNGKGNTPKTSQGSSFERGAEKRAELAKQPHARVILSRTIETAKVVDIITAADRAIHRLRKQMLDNYEPEEAIKLIKKYREAMIILNNITTELCKATGINYRSPQITPEDIKKAKEKPIKTAIGKI